MHVTNDKIRPAAISLGSEYALMHVTYVQKDLIRPAAISPGSRNVLTHQPRSEVAWEWTRANACDNLRNVPLTNEGTSGPFNK